MAKVHSGEEMLPKVSTPSRVYERYIQTTDRMICNSKDPNVVIRIKRLLRNSCSLVGKCFVVPVEVIRC